MRHVISEPVVITGIGLITSIGSTRETTWQSVQRGQSHVRRLHGYQGLPDGMILGATVDEIDRRERMRVFDLCEIASREALADANIDWPDVDRDRFGCSINAHMGDTSCLNERYGFPGDHTGPWHQQWMPNSACAHVANQLQLGGPRLSFSTACASSLVSILGAVRSIRNHQCDIAIAGGGDCIHPLFAAGFHRMRVLAEHDDPNQACRPFDRHRNGFVMGEGAAILIVERLGHALRRGATIYAEISGGKHLSEASHITGLNSDSNALSHLIDLTLAEAGLAPQDVHYINAHGTGTEQNDRYELRSIQRCFGEATKDVCVSATKSMLGHMVNGAGAAELAITALAMRDGIVPPTRNLSDPEFGDAIDCIPGVGRSNQFQHALKLAVAFGGHLVAVALSRWNDASTGFAYPAIRKAA